MDSTEAVKRNLLAVGLDADDFRLLSTYLAVHRFPYTLTKIDRAAEALERLDVERFDAVIADYLIGESTVFALLEAERPEPVLVTAFPGEERIAVKALKAGAFDYTVKDARGSWPAVLPVMVEKAVKRGETEARMRMLNHAVMSLKDAVFIADQSDRIVFVNKAFCKTYGFSESEVLGKTLDCILTDVCDELKEAHAVEGGVTAEWRHRRKDGELFPVSLTLSPVQDEKGRKTALVGVARDVSARKRIEEKLIASLAEKEALLREVHHRVKNNLQVVSSLLNLQAAQATDKNIVDALTAGRNRVRSMALIHERLYQTESLTRIDMDGYLRNLAAHVKSSFHEAGEIEVRVLAELESLGIDEAVAVGLIVNELVSNAVRHGFAKGGAGVVSIGLCPGQTPDTACLSVDDNGRGFDHAVDFQNVKTLGLTLAHMLAEQLGGEIHTQAGPGARVRLVFPVTTGAQGISA